MSDLIIRQAVLESLKTDYSLIMFDSYGNLTFTGERIIEAIKRVPPVETEEKKGHWIDGKCNRCGTHAPFWAMATTYYCSDYCPKCGADMREVQDENSNTDSK